MKAYELFDEAYNEDKIKDYYFRKVRYKAVPGMDRITRINFEKKLPYYLATIIKKVRNDDYKFTPYKEKLILKGRDKTPRVISLPSIRDKVTLGILHSILFDVFDDDLSSNRLVQIIIDQIKKKINNYDYFFKIDIQKFYASINHDILVKKIYKHIRKKEVLNLIKKAIKTPTISDYGSCYKENEKGVPEGLSISNVLANIFLSELDKKHESSEKYLYFRYVDDILVLCNKEDYSRLKAEIISEIEKKYKLTVHKETGQKREEGQLNQGFTYLGYKINPICFSVREASVLKLEHSFQNMFIDYQKINIEERNLDFFIWKLNLRITGCIFDGKKYGWVFFFSQIDDKSLLFHLDWLIIKLIKRFKLKIEPQKIKRFVRTLHEILFNLKKSNYIPNFDNFSFENQKKVLKMIYKNVDKMDEEYAHDLFLRLVFNSVQELERDIQNFS